MPIKKLKKMKMDVDTKERMKIILIFLLQSYKVLMGSMLVLFVPQMCDDKVCSIQDNLYKEDGLHRASLVINFISTASFAVCYTIELKRENWCVEHLDIDDNYGDNNLPLVLKKRPELEKALHKINDNYYYSSHITCLLYAINLIISTISIYIHSTGSATITAYMSFVILILLKLNNALFISKDSKKNNMALSAYMSELQSFNIIDKDHQTEEEKKLEMYKKNGLLMSEKTNEDRDGIIVADLNLV